MSGSRPPSERPSSAPRPSPDAGEGPPNLVLVGARGCGKTTLGRALAERLGRPFADADELLAARVGRPAERYLAEAGEAAFRAVEAEVLREAAGWRGVVLATGGGAVEQPAFAALARASRVIYLRAGFATLLARQRAVPRTRLLDGTLEEEIRALLRRRAPLYEAAADRIVSVEQPDPILALLRDLPEG